MRLKKFQALFLSAMFCCLTLPCQAEMALDTAEQVSAACVSEDSEVSENEELALSGDIAKGVLTASTSVPKLDVKKHKHKAGKKKHNKHKSKAKKKGQKHKNKVKNKPKKSNNKPKHKDKKHAKKGNAPTKLVAPQAKQANKGNSAHLMLDEKGHQFHTAHCKSGKGLTKRSTAGREELVEKGYQPCGKCNP